MRGAIPPPQYVFLAWCLDKHRDNFTLPYFYRPSPKLKDHTLSAVRDCLFDIFANTLHTRRPSPPSAAWRRAVPGHKDPPNV